MYEKGTHGLDKLQVNRRLLIPLTIIYHNNIFTKYICCFVAQLGGIHSLQFANYTTELLNLVGRVEEASVFSYCVVLV